MDLVAVVSTGNDVWSLSVTGQLLNETWANIGVTWEPHSMEKGLEWDKRGGLTVSSYLSLSLTLSLSLYRYLSLPLSLSLSLSPSINF
jgi:hypothetical protein